MPEKLEQYFEQILQKFSVAKIQDFKDMDKQIGDVLHQHYKEKLFQGKIELLASEIFSVLDQALCSKKSVNEAKNYKKLLAAIQKSKIVHPTEMSVLFVKANRFINKEAIKKEKQQIKKEI